MKKDNPLAELPFSGLDEKTMIELQKAGHELTVVAKFDFKTNEIIGNTYHVNRDGLAFLTGKTQSTIDNWVRKGWLKPAIKHGTYSLFRLEDVQHMLRERKFPRGRTEIYPAATRVWIKPNEEQREAIETEDRRVTEEVEALRRADMVTKVGRKSA